MVVMNDRVAGDKAVLKFEQEVTRISGLAEKPSKKISMITDALSKAAQPWNLKGDDRVLSIMRTAAGGAVEHVIKVELERIGNSRVKDKPAKFKALERLADDLPWLASGFKSSIKVDIAFAISRVRIAALQGK